MPHLFQSHDDRSGTAGVRVEVPLPPKLCSPNGSHGHWGGKQAARNEYRDVCAGRFERAQVGALATPVTVHLEFYLARPKTDAEVYRLGDRYFPRDEFN